MFELLLVLVVALELCIVSCTGAALLTSPRILFSDT